MEAAALSHTCRGIQAHPVSRWIKIRIAAFTFSHQDMHPALVCRGMEGSLRREYDGRRQPSPNLPMRPDHYAANLSDSHDLGPYSRAPTPQSDTSSTSRFGSFVDRGASSSSSSSHRMPSGQPRHASSRSATPLVRYLLSGGHPIVCSVSMSTTVLTGMNE